MARRQSINKAVLAVNTEQVSSHVFPYAGHYKRVKTAPLRVLFYLFCGLDHDAYIGAWFHSEGGFDKKKILKNTPSD